MPVSVGSHGDRVMALTMRARTCRFQGGRGLRRRSHRQAEVLVGRFGTNARLKVLCMASPYRNAYNAAYSSSSSSSSSWESPGVSLVEKARKSITTTQEYVARVATPSSNPALNAGIWVVAFTVAAACVKLAMPALPETSQAKKDDINRSARRVDRGANSVSISERIQLLGETVTNRLLGEENAISRQPRIADAKQRPAASNLSGRDEACAVASNNAAELQESQAALYRGALSNSDLAMFDLRFIAAEPTEKRTR